MAVFSILSMSALRSVQLILILARPSFKLFVGLFGIVKSKAIFEDSTLMVSKHLTLRSLHEILPSILVFMRSRLVNWSRVPLTFRSASMMPLAEMSSGRNDLMSSRSALAFMLMLHAMAPRRSLTVPLAARQLLFMLALNELTLMSDFPFKSMFAFIDVLRFVNG